MMVMLTAIIAAAIPHPAAVPCDLRINWIRPFVGFVPDPGRYGKDGPQHGNRQQQTHFLPPFRQERKLAYIATCSLLNRVLFVRWSSETGPPVSRPEKR